MTPAQQSMSWGQMMMIASTWWAQEMYVYAETWVHNLSNFPTTIPYDVHDITNAMIDIIVV